MHNYAARSGRLAIFVAFYFLVAFFSCCRCYTLLLRLVAAAAATVVLLLMMRIFWWYFLVVVFVLALHVVFYGNAYILFKQLNTLVGIFITFSKKKIKNQLQNELSTRAEAAHTSI